jgi:hypothetical protein
VISVGFGRQRWFVTYFEVHCPVSGTLGTEPKDFKSAPTASASAVAIKNSWLVTDFLSFHALIMQSSAAILQ